MSRSRSSSGESSPASTSLASTNLSLKSARPANGRLQATVKAPDYFKLVELARELAQQTGLRLSRPGAIATLEAIPTGGKTKRVVADLLALGARRS